MITPGEPLTVISEFDIGAEGERPLRADIEWNEAHHLPDEAQPLVQRGLRRTPPAGG